MVDFVTSLHATFGRKLAKLRGSVEDAFFNGKCKTHLLMENASKFWAFLPLKFKKTFFWGGNEPQNPKFSKFSQNRNICYSATSPLPVYKISSQ